MKVTLPFVRLAMARLLFAALVCAIPYAASAQCCLTNTLILNTGYDPLGAGAAVPAGTQGGTPVPDPYWKVCETSWGLSHDVATFGLMPVAPNAAADVIQPAPGWITFPVSGPGGPGNWVNSFNGYHYMHTTDSNYGWTLSRTFTLHCDARVTFDFTNVTFDNWLLAGGIDGPGCGQPGPGYIPFPGVVLSPYCCYGLMGSIGISVFGGNPGIFYTIPSLTVNLAAGIHTMYFKMLNDNTPGNNIAALIQARISTPTPSIVPENIACPMPGICPTVMPPICAGATQALTDPGVSGSAWSSDNTAVATVNTSGIVTGVSAGTANITYNVPSGIGCPYIFKITVTPVGNITTRTNVRICAADGPVSLQAAAGYTSYQWNTGSTEDTMSTAVSGTYWVRTLGSACGVHTDTFHVTIKPMPVVSLGNDTIVCTSKTVTLSSQQPTGAKYDWSTGSHTPSITVSKAGTYGLMVTLDSCSTTDTVRLTEMSKPVVALGRDTTICDKNELLLLLQTKDANIAWSTGARTRDIVISASGTYWVIASNICGAAADTITVNFGICNIGLPTGFSPNGDGANDVLYVRGAGIETMTLKIYNRWGQMLFETTDQRIGWDGTFDGQPQPMEAYGYVLLATLKDGANKMMKGNVTLIR